MSVPKSYDTVRWYHRLLALPIRLLNALNIGPFGGENSVSAVIEAVIKHKKGEEIDIDLSKTEKFVFERFKNSAIAPQIIEIRKITFELQEEVLKRFSNQALGVIWIGAGLVSGTYPLIAKRKPEDIHFWTDPNIKVQKNARAFFEEMQKRGEASGLVYDVYLPDDVDKVNRMIKALLRFDVEHFVLICTGFVHVLSPQDQLKWLRALEWPPHLPCTVVLNGPSDQMPLNAKVAGAIYRQHIYRVDREHIVGIFNEALPGSDIIWERPREDTEFGIYEAWLVHRPALTDVTPE